MLPATPQTPEPRIPHACFVQHLGDNAALGDHAARADSIYEMFGFTGGSKQPASSLQDAGIEQNTLGLVSLQGEGLGMR